MPDFALIVAVVTVIYLVFLFGAGEKLFRDSDAGWHIRAGEQMLATGALPRSDPYSFTKAGAPWYTWEWLADGAMGVAHQAAGLRGVAWLYVVMLAACSWLWIRLHWAVGGSFLMAAAMALPMLSTVNLHWLARPHVFSWVLLLTGLLWVETLGDFRLRFRSLLPIVLFGCLWANLHASFPLAFILLLIAGVGAWLEPLLFEGRPARDPQWFWAAALSFGLGTLVNPFGWQLHRHIVAYLANGELLARIGEFQSFNFQVEGAGAVAMTVLLAAVGLVCAVWQGRLAHALMTGLLLYGALRSARMLPLLALVALPLANGAVTEALARMPGLRPRARKALDGFLQYSANLRALERNLRGGVWVPILMVCTGLALGWMPSGFPADQFPVSAFGKLPLDAQRVLAPDKFGGYMIYASSGERKVFFDGRSDFYGVEFMKEYIRLVEVRPGWAALVDRHAFTHALLPVNYSLIPALEARGWRVTHRDRTAAILEAPRKGSHGPQ